MASHTAVSTPIFAAYISLLAREGSPLASVPPLASQEEHQGPS